MSNFFVALGVFLITVISSLFAIPYFVDWNGYRGAFEEEATQFLGREVRVGGSVNLHLLPVPFVRLEKVRIADAIGNLQEPFFRADSLALKLSIAPLLRGVLEANEIEFRRPILRLARDTAGRWNWQSFGRTLAEASYLPSNIALTSLKISDGMLALHDPDGAERARVEGITGELSAPSIDGPYRFKGTLTQADSEREIRIATAKPDPDGAVRFRASMRSFDSGSIHVVDARILDLMGEPKLEGEITARLPITGLLGSSAKIRSVDVEQTTPAAERSTPPAFDVKAQVQADAAGANLSDLSLSFEQDGRPQLITGKAAAQWKDTLTVDLNLVSRWLDLDRIAGIGDGAAPAESIVPFVAQIRNLLPDGGRSRASIAIDQANLARDSISNVRVVVERTQDELKIEQLRIGMPGGSRAELSGLVTGSPGAPVFDGAVEMRGASLVRFLAWASASAVSPADPRGDGGFGAHLELTVSRGRMIARNVVGEFLGTALQGQADWRWEGQSELSLEVEAPQLDVRAFVPADAEIGNALNYLLGGVRPNETEGAAAVPEWYGSLPNLNLHLEIGQLITAARSYRDVALHLDLRSGNLELPVLRLSDDQGLIIDVKGRLQQITTHPKGSLTGVLAARKSQDLIALTERLGIPHNLRPGDRIARALSPLRLAASAVFGSRTPTSIDLTLDGEANSATLRVKGAFDGAAAGWRHGKADLTVALEAANANKISALLLPESISSSKEKAASGQLLLKAAGVPAQGLSGIATVSAGDVLLDFSGMFTLGASGNRMTGDLQVKAADGAGFAALAGISPPLRLAGSPVEGFLKIRAGEEEIDLERLVLNVGGSEVRGKLAISLAKERRRVDARLSVSQISVKSALAPLIDRRLAAVTEAAEAAISGRQNPWPEEPFDIRGLKNFKANIELDVGYLTSADNVGMRDARLDVALEDGKIDVRRIEGSALGGRITGAMSIGDAGSLAEITGTLHLAGGKVDAAARLPAGKTRERPVLNMELAFSGKGTSPRNIITALRGQGTANVDGKLSGLWPGAIAIAADEVRKGEPDRLSSTLQEALRTGLSAGRISLPSAIGLEIADGQVRSRPVSIEAADGRATGTATLNLQTLMFESEWRVQQSSADGNNQQANKPPLPAVTVRYQSHLEALGSIEPRVASEALERELSVRRMERDVEELERLRRLDEARRRSEAERLRQEIERSAPPTPLPVAPVTPARPATPG